MLLDLMRARKKLRKAALSLLFLIVMYVFIFCLADTHNFQMLYAFFYRTKSEKSDTHIKNAMRMEKKYKKRNIKSFSHQKGVEIQCVHLSLVQKMRSSGHINTTNFTFCTNLTFHNIFMIIIQLIVYQNHLILTKFSNIDF